MATRAYLTFLLDSRGMIEGSASRSPGGRQPEAPDELKVIFDRWRITVIGYQDKRTRVLAHARWRKGELDRRKLVKGERALTAEEWIWIAYALGQQISSTRGTKPPKPKPMVAKAETGEVEIEPMLRLDEPSSRFKAVVWGTMAAILAVTAVLSFTCTRADEPATVTAAPAPTKRAVPAPPPPRPVEQPVEVRITKAESFGDAIRLAKPKMTSATVGLGAGTQLFATYAVDKLRWEDVDVAAETSFGHVLKDLEVERGKRMCADGELVAIERRDLGARKIYVGVLRVSSADALTFVAVGTTGELIRGSKARFCGAVTGKSGPTVSMVGMFDLPENRTPIVEQ